MNTSQIKTFAQKGRNILIEGVASRLEYWGFNSKGEIVEEPMFVQGGAVHRGQTINDLLLQKKWNALKKAVANHSVEHIVEEGAYTWFNRIMAIRILSKNDYDPSQLDYGNEGQETPELLRRARAGSYSFLSIKEQDLIRAVITDYSREYTAFSILLNGYCNLHPLLSRVFGKLDDYTTLLLPVNILDDNGFIHLLNTSTAISNEDYQQPELIGWLYQFYISEKKDQVFANFKKNKKAEAEDIPAATQIFTPNWIVKYMVENTAGKIWLELKPESKLRDRMKYLVKAKEIYDPTETRKVTESTEIDNSTPTISEIAEMKILDPACGSGHILVEAFDLLYEMYMEEFYLPKDAVESILRNNLFGLDLDLRAVQLSRFAILLKAATKNREILKGDLVPRVYSMPDPESFTYQELEDIFKDIGKPYIKEIYDALNLMQQAQNLGSIMRLKLSKDTQNLFYNYFKTREHPISSNLQHQITFNKLQSFLPILEILTDKFSAVVANPPYMGSGTMNSELKKYVTKQYPASKSDLFAVFMEVCLALLKKSGKMGMINQHSWMFLSSYEKLRNELLNAFTIENMLHLGPRTFDELSGEVVQSTAFVISHQTKTDPNTVCGEYFRLIDYKSSEAKHEQFLDRNHFFLAIPQSNFSKIPGNPIAYWLPDEVFEIFLINKQLKDYAYPKSGMSTSNNDRFLRQWYEVSRNRIVFKANSLQIFLDSDAKWAPYNKGGGIRWSSNVDYVVNWENNGAEIKQWVVQNPKDPNTKHWTRRICNPDYFFKSGITWSDVSMGSLSAKKLEVGYIFDSVGVGLYDLGGNENYILGLLNSNVAQVFLQILSPTIHYNPGSVAKLPTLIPDTTSSVENIVQKLICFSSEYLRYQEISTEFLTCPIVSGNDYIKQDYLDYIAIYNSRLFQQIILEEILNNEFINIYNLGHFVDPSISLSSFVSNRDELEHSSQEKLVDALKRTRDWKYEDKKWALYINEIVSSDDIEDFDFSIPNETLASYIHPNRIIRQLISYAIGCILGRFRLDKPGFHITHPNSVEKDIEPYFLDLEALNSIIDQGDIKGKSFKENNKESDLKNVSIGPKITFEIDNDGIIPMMTRDCGFSDNGIDRIREFIEKVWGEETLTENMNFLEECLDISLEDYLVKHFWKDHCKRYKKRPIYWLFSSEKGAFQVLVYMHRMNRYTAEKIRSNYLLKHIGFLNGQINQLQPREAMLSRQEARQLDKYRKDLMECEQYDLLLKDVADKQIEFNLDDGVKVNYKKFEGVVAPIK